MEFISVFDVIGPNMIGPSSSHTAGAAVIGYLAHKLLPGPLTAARFTLYNSFARTGRGHGTDRALLGGVLGFATDDTRIRDSFDIAAQRGLAYTFDREENAPNLHPNTADIALENAAGQRLTVRGESLGGGKVRICRLGGVEVDFTGEYATAVVVHRDRPGLAAHITRCLGEAGVNIAFMRVYREARGETAYTVVESDGVLPDGIADALRAHEHVHDVMIIQK